MENSSSTTRTTTAQSVPDMVAAIRFIPTEKEMADYLRKKMKSHKSQACHFLPVIDVCKFEPWDLPVRMFPDSVFQAKTWYSFSCCDYKYINSLRCNRVTEHGFWKITGKPRDISLKYFTCKKRTLTFQEGGASKSVRTGWIIHEYYCTKPKQGSSPRQERDLKRDYVLCLLKYKPVDSKSDKKKPEGTSVCDDLADPGNCGYIATSPGDDHAASAAAMNHMAPDTEEVLAYKELEDDLLGSGNHDHGEPGGGVSSDSFDQALRDMIHESYAPLGGFLDLLFPPPEPPQLHQPPQPHQPPQLGNSPDIYSHELVDPGSGTGGCIPYNFDNQAAAMNHMVPNTEEILDMDSPLSPPEPPQPHQLGNFPDIHSGEFSNWPSTIGDNDSYDIIKNNIATNYDNEPVINIDYNSQNLATNERISEAYSQPEENRGSPFQQLDQLQNYTLQSCAPAGEYLNSLFPLPQSPQPHQPPQLGNAPDVCSDESIDPGTVGCITYNTDNQAAAMNHVISDTEEILTYKQLELAVLGNGNHGDGEPSSGISSYFIDQAPNDMILEFPAGLQKDLDSPFPPPEPPQTHQPHQLGDVPDAHSGKFSNCPSSIGDNGFYHTNKNNIAINYDNEQVINIAYNSPNCATNERISEVYSQPEENRGSPFQAFDQLQNYTLQSCAPAGEYLNSLFPLPQSPQPHQPPQLGNAPDVCSDELVDPGTGGCVTYSTDNQAAAMNHVISDTEEILAYKQLERAVLGNGNHGDGEPSSGISSYFIDQAPNDMILEFSAGLQKDLDSPFPPPEPPQTHQPHQLGDVPDAHSGEFSNCPSPIGDNGSYLTNKNNIATNYDNKQVINIAYNSPNWATNERISEAYSQPEENRGSPFQPFDQLQNYPLQSPILFSELGELLLANTCIGRNESQSLNMEPVTLFPQSS